MDALQIEALLLRLSRVERENRRMKVGGLLTLAILCLFLFLGATRGRKPAPLEEVRAKRFVLVDNAGKERGALAVFADTVDLETFELTPRDMVALDLRNKGNTARLAVSQDSAGLSFSSFTGARSLMVMRSDGRSSLSLWRSGGGERVETAGIRVRPDGSTGLSLRDKNGQARLNLSLAQDGSPYMAFVDNSNQTSIAMEGSDQTRRLVLADQTGAVRVALSTLASGRPVVLLLDASGNQRAQLTVLKDGSPSIALFDTDKNIVWSAP